MSQKVPVNTFERIEDTQHPMKDFITDYVEESNKGYFFEVMFNILKNYMNLLMIYHFYQK